MKCLKLLLGDLGSVFRPSVDQFVAAAERLLCVEVLSRATALPLLNMFLRIFLDNLQQQPNQRKVCDGNTRTTKKNQKKKTKQIQRTQNKERHYADRTLLVFPPIEIGFCERCIAPVETNRGHASRTGPH